ncbi:MAG: hypothetical protein WCF23_18715 [Candidatus Nitrosopolaris sp.]
MSKSIGGLLLFTVTCAFLIATIATPIFPNFAYAHITGDRTQQWINPQDNVKIQFTYEPEKPLIGSPTELKFSVQNLKTGQHLKDLFAKVTIINGQRVFKFNNLTVSDGDFSVNSTFPNEGTYQVILRINSKDYAIALASFRVFVPFQPLGTINLNYTIPLLLPAALAGIIGVIVIATFLIIVKREYKKRRSPEE